MKRAYTVHGDKINWNGAFFFFFYLWGDFNKHKDKNDKSNHTSWLLRKTFLYSSDWFHDIRTSYRQCAIRLLHTFFVNNSSLLLHLYHFFSLSLSLCVFQHVFVKRFLGISHQWQFLVESQSWEIRITVELCFLIKGIYHIHLLRSHI